MLISEEEIEAKRREFCTAVMREASVEVVREMHKEDRSTTTGSTPKQKLEYVQPSNH